MRKETKTTNLDETTRREIGLALSDARTVRTILLKLTGSGHRCGPEVGILLTEVMLEKTEELVERLRPLADEETAGKSDEVDVLFGEMDYLMGGKIMVN